jgi:hypothetical protein
VGTRKHKEIRMLRRAGCALVPLVLLVGIAAAAEYKGTLKEVNEGKSIKVRVGGKLKTFKINDKTKYVKHFKGDTKEVVIGELTTMLFSVKGGFPVEFSTKGKKGDEVVTKLHFGQLDKKKKKGKSEK